MSFQIKMVTGLVVAASLALMVNDADAQLFRINNSNCQPVRIVVRPACPTYFIPSPTMVQSQYFYPAQSLPQYALPYNLPMTSAPIINQSFEANNWQPAPIISNSQPQLDSGASQASASDIAPSNLIAPALFEAPTPAAAESTLTNLQPEPTEEVKPETQAAPTNDDFQPQPEEDEDEVDDEGEEGAKSVLNKG